MLIRSPTWGAFGASLAASLSLLVAGALAAPALAQIAPGGTYAVSGSDTSGSPYTGTVTVTPSGPIFNASWQIASTTQTGVGIQQGPYLGVGWGDSNCVVVDYAVQADGTLQGQWVDVGSSTLGTETDIPSSPSSNTYTVTGTNPDRSTYGGTLTVTPQGSVLQFSWQAGSNFEGVGIGGSAGVTSGSNVAVGYGANGQGNGCGVALYAINGDGSLNGIWGLYGVGNLGSETWTPQSPVNAWAGLLAGGG